MLPSWKDIAVLTQADAAGEPPVRAAAALALRHGAALTGLCAMAHPAAAPEDGFARGTGIRDVIARERAAGAVLAQTACARFDEIVEPYDIHADFRTGWLDGVGEQAAIHALHCDFIVAGHSPLTRLPPAWSAEALLFSHGVPVLLTSGHLPEVIGDRILLAWNGSREARRAANDALPFLTRANAVTILVVDDAGDVAPVAGPSVTEALRHLACHGVQAEPLRVGAKGRTVAASIQAEAARLACDLIVLGGYSHGRATEFVFGGVTRTLLAAAGPPVFVSR